ncbi:MAG: L,D-transpeptidase [Bacteroidota bacterium]|nr:L,D-transpeptidase [Bacteroidota bacterium]
MKYPHDSWNYFLWFDYPNADSYKKFKDIKAKKLIPQDATIGGEVGIHGVPAGYDYLIVDGKDWTCGCISLTNEHIKKVYESCEVGSSIIIKP